MGMKRYDIAIIGAGTAGLSARREIAKKTDNYVVIDPGPLGTTCARIGCMPSKVLLQAAEDFDRRRHFSRLGISGSENLSIDRRQTLRHVRSLRARFVRAVMQGVDEWRETHLIAKKAQFVDSHTLDLEGERIHADRSVIATGSHPMRPRAWEAFSRYMVDTDTFFERDDLPERMAVIGLGVIGLELGQALAKFGVEVSGYNLGHGLGGLTDPKLKEYMSSHVAAQFPVAYEGVEHLEMGHSGLVVHGGGTSHEVDVALLAMGRKPNLQGLGLENLGLDLDQQGLPPFNRGTLQVEGTDIFIAGDVTGERPVLHEAADGGRIAGHNAAASKPHCFQRRFPLTITFSSPNIALVGRSHQSLVDDQVDFVTGEASFEGQGRSIVLLEEAGSLRVYGERYSGKLLGAELIAPRGEHLAHLLAWSLSCGLTVHDVLAMPFYHPVVEEGLRTALRDLAQKTSEGASELELLRCAAPPVGS